MFRDTTSVHEELEVVLSLRELFSKNRCALLFDDETLTKLLYREQLIARRVAAHEVEAAREALVVDNELLA